MRDSYLQQIFKILEFKKVVRDFKESLQHRTNAEFEDQGYA